jgi:hypothetical protein
VPIVPNLTDQKGMYSPSDLVCALVQMDNASWGWFFARLESTCNFEDFTHSREASNPRQHIDAPFPRPFSTPMRIIRQLLGDLSHPDG